MFLDSITNCVHGLKHTEDQFCGPFHYLVQKNIEVNNFEDQDLPLNKNRYGRQLFRASAQLQGQRRVRVHGAQELGQVPGPPRDEGRPRHVPEGRRVS